MPIRYHSLMTNLEQGTLSSLTMKTMGSAQHTCCSGSGRSSSCCCRGCSHGSTCSGRSRSNRCCSRGRCGGCLTCSACAGGSSCCYRLKRITWISPDEIRFRSRISNSGRRSRFNINYGCTGIFKLIFKVK